MDGDTAAGLICGDLRASPIFRLPPEVLSLIFIFVVKMNRFGGRGKPFGRGEEASFLTEICSKWTSIALDTPEIWACILIKPCHEHNTGLDRDRLRACLARAKSFPLSVEVVANGRDAGFLLLQLVTEYTNWKSLMIYIGRRMDADSCATFLGMMKDNLSSLRQLKVRGFWMNRINTSFQIWKGRNPFPKLEILEFDEDSNLRVFPMVDTSIFPYHQLTEITLDFGGRFTDVNNPEHRVRDTLILCQKRIRSAKLYLQPPSTNSTNPLPKLTFPSLEHLEIHTVPLRFVIILLGQKVDPFFDAFIDLVKRYGVSKTLQKFQLCYDGMMTMGMPPELASCPRPLLDFLKHTTGLVDLRITASPRIKTEQDWVAFLREFWEITMIQDGSRMKAFEDPLTASYPMPCILPKLEHLHISYVIPQFDCHLQRHPNPCEWLKEFVAMVGMRSANGLQSVFLEVVKSGISETEWGLDHYMDLELLRRLQEDMGLAIRVVKRWYPITFTDPGYDCKKVKVLGGSRRPTIEAELLRIIVVSCSVSPVTQEDYEKAPKWSMLYIAEDAGLTALVYHYLHTRTSEIPLATSSRFDHTNFEAPTRP
ncbi:hypothetical protein E1B28_013800 [Marasmius oreades]|uniref:F-box domain-containing protein n=1 Tax=Marasmius oreades TaxID=181124 RepID=A0A9P7RQY1_9AGAR|nr:uncharacterized protein E1B28_013800 [Marasmius oreades]KAG7087862.1 hypothetical protein E1B28_013800 [Marasmius oreades]